MTKVDFLHKTCIQLIPCKIYLCIQIKSALNPIQIVLLLGIDRRQVPSNILRLLRKLLSNFLIKKIKRIYIAQPFLKWHLHL